MTKTESQVVHEESDNPRSSTPAVMKNPLVSQMPRTYEGILQEENEDLRQQLARLKDLCAHSMGVAKQILEHHEHVGGECPVCRRIYETRFRLETIDSTDVPSEPSQPQHPELTAEQRVKAVYPRAWSWLRVYNPPIYDIDYDSEDKQNWKHIGSGSSPAAAWEDAASRLPKE